MLKLLQIKAHPVCYDGFEPSGRMHIAQGILKAINVNRCGRPRLLPYVNTEYRCVKSCIYLSLLTQPWLLSSVPGRLTRAGCVFKFWVADWFALLNNKMGGDLKKIRTVGLYMIEVSPGVYRSATPAVVVL